MLLWGCHLDVQGLLHQWLLSSAVVQDCGLLPVDWVVFLLCMVCYCRVLISPHRHLCVPSILSPVFNWSPQCTPGHSCRGCNIPHWIAYPGVMYPSPWLLLNAVMSRHGVMRRHGGMSNPCQPLTSNSVYRYLCSVIVVLFTLLQFWADDDWTIQLKDQQTYHELASSSWKQITFPFIYVGANWEAIENVITIEARSFEKNIT